MKTSNKALKKITKIMVAVLFLTTVSLKSYAQYNPSPNTMPGQSPQNTYPNTNPVTNPTYTQPGGTSPTTSPTYNSPTSPKIPTPKLKTPSSDSSSMYLKKDSTSTPKPPKQF